MRYEWPTELSKDDKLDIIELMNAVAVREHTLGFPEPLSEDEGMALMDAYEADLKKGTLNLLAVRNDTGKIVAMVTLARAALPARHHVVDMRRCVIAPAYRGQFLLEGWAHALHKVKEMGCEVITLEVRDDGPVDLWRRIGFRDYGVLPDYARHEGKPVTGYYMFARCSEILGHFEETGSWLFDEPLAAAR